uniref:Tudor domain-containing protein n=1 Tax=Macrostomum lignano TaxID=282301 RepID=A0A1I8I0A5_9PLAT
CGRPASSAPASELRLSGCPWTAQKADGASARRLLLRLVELMQRNGWQLLTSARIKDSSDSLALSLQQAQLMLISLHDKQSVRMEGGDPDSDSTWLANALNRLWHRGVQSHGNYYGAVDIRLGGSPWLPTDKNSKNLCRQLICRLLGELRTRGWRVLHSLDIYRRYPVIKSAFLFARTAPEPEPVRHCCFWTGVSNRLSFIDVPEGLLESSIAVANACGNVASQKAREHAYELKFRGQACNKLDWRILLTNLLGEFTTNGWRLACTGNVSGRFYSDDSTSYSLEVHSWWFAWPGSAERKELEAAVSATAFTTAELASFFGARRQRPAAPDAAFLRLAIRPSASCASSGMPNGHRRTASHSGLDSLSKCTQCGAGTQVNQALQSGGEMAHEVHPFQNAYFMLGPFTSDKLVDQACHLYAVIDGSGDGSQALAGFFRQHLPAEVLLELSTGMPDETVADVMRNAILRVDNMFKTNVVTDNQRRIEDAQQRVRQLRESRSSSEADLMESLAQLHSLKEGLGARCSLAMALLYSEKLYVASVGGSCRALLCRMQPRRQALRFQLLTPSAPPTSANYLLGSPEPADTPLVSLTGPAKDDRTNNGQIVSLVAKELRNNDNSLLAASQSVVDNVVRLHKEAVFYAGDCDQQVIRDDMTLLVRDFHYRQLPGQQGSDTQQHTFLIASGPDSADNSLDSGSNSLDTKHFSDLCDAYLPLAEWQAALDSLTEEQLARVRGIINQHHPAPRDIIREESIDEGSQPSAGTGAAEADADTDDEVDAGDDDVENMNDANVAHGQLKQKAAALENRADFAANCTGELGQNTCWLHLQFGSPADRDHSSLLLVTIAGMDSPAYHCLVLAGCAVFWYLTYRTQRPVQLHSVGIGYAEKQRRQVLDSAAGAVGDSAADAAADADGPAEAGDQTVATADTYKVALMSIPREAIGAIIGKDGAAIRQLQQTTKTKITFVNRAANGGDGPQADGRSASATEPVRIRGEARCVHAAEEELRRLIAAVPRKETAEFRLASRYIGPLIGRGGQNVRDLMTQSRCKIDVERGGGGGGRLNEENRLVTLCGTQDQIDLAKSLIDQLCAEIDQRDARRSTNRSRNGAPNSANGANSASSSPQQPQPPAQQPQPPAQQPQPPAQQPQPPAQQPQPPAQQPQPPAQQPQPPAQQPPQPPYPVRFAAFPATNEPISVCVSAVGDDPLVFYLLCDNEQSRSLSNLVCSMVEYYNGLKPDHPLGCNLCPGELVAAYYEPDQTWQRARVVSVDLTQQQQAMLDVDCLDYGDSLMVPVGRAFRLQPQFCELPFQAIRCTLDAELVLPAGASDECIAEFQRLTKCATYEPIRARLIRFQPGTGEPVLQLLVPAGADSNSQLCVTEELRRQGFLL